MRPRRQNGKEILFIGLAALALAAVNFVLRRFIDGSLCLIAGIVALLVWHIKRRR